MLEIFRKRRSHAAGPHREVIPELMGYPGSDFSRYDPYGEERWTPERKSIHALEGAGRKGWDYDQNRGYGMVYGNESPGAAENRNHRGKGPRNYQRSDERIQEDIHEKISNDWALDASEVEISVEEGVVQLKGKVHQRSVKHRLEDICEAVRGVKEVENKLRVEK